MRNTGFLLVTVASLSALCSFNLIPAIGTTNSVKLETQGSVSIPQMIIPDCFWEGQSRNDCTFVSVHQDNAERPNFSGRWNLNRHASDDAGKMVKDALVRNRKIETSLGLRVRQVFMRRRNDLDQDLGRVLVQVLEAPKSLLILHEEKSLTIVDTNGGMRTLSFDATPSIELGQGFAVTTRWSGMQLVSDVNFQNQGSARLTLALAPGGFQLHLTEQIQPFVLGKPIIVHNLYDFVAEN